MVLPLKGLKENGGETGIRTLDTLRYTRFPSVRLQPLGHLSLACQTRTSLSEPAHLTEGPQANHPYRVGWKMASHSRQPPGLAIGHRTSLLQKASAEKIAPG